MPTVSVNLKGDPNILIKQVEEVRLRLLNALRSEGRQVQKDFNRTVATWEHKPTFETKIKLGRQDPVPEVTVWTDDENYARVEYGTRPHIIAPKNAKALYYQEDFTPKTQPRVIDSKTGGKSGNYVVRGAVQHPGFEARQFSEEIKKLHDATFQEHVESEIARGVAQAQAKA